MSPHAAIRLNGVCLGSLWKQHSSTAAPPKIVEFSADGNERSKSHDYCMLIGHTLFSYPDINAYNRGDHAMSEVRIVGASSWNPAATTTTPSTSTALPTFLLVTYAGTHIYCSAPSLPDRDTWLSALHSGLEASYAPYHETLLQRKKSRSSSPSHSTPSNSSNNTSQNRPLTSSTSLSDDNRRLLAPPPPATLPITRRLTRRLSTKDPTKNLHCVSCGQYPPESDMRRNAAPLPQYGIESRADLCGDCLTAQGLLSHVTALCGLYGSYAHERAALSAAREAAVQAVQNALEQRKGMEKEEEANNDGEDNDGTDTTEKVDEEDEMIWGFGNDLGESWGVRPPGSSSGLNSFVHVSPADAGSKALVKLISTSGFATYRRRSQALEVACLKLERGSIGGAIEFLDMLGEQNGDPISIRGLGDFGMNGRQESFKLKKEAFKVGGDMSAAIKMLAEHALPERSPGLLSNDTNADVEMLVCILEFLLELCDEGELGSVAFFWPQLRHIHLRMLPPQDADALIRVELVEDFLLTVSTKHSVHLALELVWGLVADLEEAMEENATPTCRARRWAVLRFCCELESMLFDELEEGGCWGDGMGNICMNAVLKPSPHQQILIREQMSVLGLHRRFSNYNLTKSIRVEKLMRDVATTNDNNKSPSTPTPKRISSRRTNLKAVHEYLGESATDLSSPNPTTTTIPFTARDYYKAQIAFVRRLGDIAEKLRHMDVEKRKDALKEEIEYLYTSGKITGGDPLSRAGEGISSVIKVPSNEGHVFRSKERTPILLLMEVLRPTVPDETSAGGEVSSEATAPESYSRKSRNDSSVASSSGGGTTPPPPPTIDRRKVDALMDQLTNGDHTPSARVSQLMDELTGVDVKEEKIKSLMKELSGEDIRDEAIKTLMDELTLELPPPPPPPTEGEEKSNHYNDELYHDDDGGGAGGDHLLLESFGSRNQEDEKEISDSDEGRGSESFGSSSERMMMRSPKPVRKLKKFDSPAPAESASSSDHSIVTSTLQKRGSIDNTFKHLPAIPSLDNNNITNNDPSMTGTPPSTAFDHGNSSSSRSSSKKTHQNNRKSNILNNKQNTSTAHQYASPSSRKIPNQQQPLFNEFGEGRREVLTTILHRGMRGSYIAKKASAAAQRAVQAMDRQRAVKLMNNEDRTPSTSSTASYSTHHSSSTTQTHQLQEEFAPRGTSGISSPHQQHHHVYNNGEDTISSNPEENEAIDSLRILLLQNRVAQQVVQGTLKPENAQKALDPTIHFGSVTHAPPIGAGSFAGTLDLREASDSLSQSNIDSSELRVSFEDNSQSFDEIIVDAGEVDARLSGCGPLSPGVLNALRLWKSGIVSNGELLELVQKDLQYLRQTTIGDAKKLIEDSAFWVRFAFGERWAEKKARLAATSPHGTNVGWDLVGIIVKSNDDLRQEAFVMQLIELCQEAFEIAGLELWVNPYRIIATGRSTGIIECLHNALSFDSLKKRPGYGKGGLKGHFERMVEFDTNPREAFETAQRNFVRSLAAYSLMSYLFLFKDRHNGNLLLDTQGHVIHIDFGFVFGIAPGGSFSLEMNTPFKLTEEMLEVMGGIGSPLFSEFVTLFCCGFLALQAHVETFCTIVEVMCIDSTFKCFEGKEAADVIDKLRQRFRADLDKADSVVFALDLIKQSSSSYGTKQYDYFQYLSQGIAT